MRRLEQKFLNELVILGVHAAKFPNEKDKDNLYNAVKRYELDHPVINDVNMEVARAYEFRAWPTLWFIDPQGKLIGKHEGEMSYESLEDLVTRMVAEFEAKVLELGPDQVAAFIGEPVFGSGGVMVPPAGYHRRIWELCRRYDILYIADEVFFTGTAAEITPIRAIDQIAVGDGKRGPITARLQELFFQATNAETEDRHGWLTFVADA